MKTLLRKMTSFLMAFFMVIQVMLPAFTITSKAEEVKPNTIKSIEEIKDDENVNLSITKSQQIYDKKHIKKDQDKFSLALTMPDTTSNFRLVKRIDLKLYDDGYFDSNEQASKEYWRVKDMLNDQGLDLDLEIINDEEGYRLVTKEELENIEENEKESPYGSNYTYIDFKVMDNFDFNEKGNQKLFNEDKLVFNLEFLQYESLDPNFNLYEKDKDGNLTIKNEGDIFALIRDENKTLYTTKSLKEDFENLNNLIEEENEKQEEKIQKEEAEKEKSQQDQPIKKEEDKKASISSTKEEKKEDEKTSSNKKESQTEVEVKSNEPSIEKKDTNKDSKDQKTSTTSNNKEENQDQKEKSSENIKPKQKSEDKKEKKKAEKKGLMPKLRMLFLGQDEPAKEKVKAAQNDKGKLNLENKKFTIRTRFDTSTRQGPIKAGQYFNIHLDKKLTVNDPSKLEDIIYKGNVIAKPSYDQASNTIMYKIVRDIDEDINQLLSIDVDYNSANITPGESFTVINSISGLGVTNPKNLPAEKIDKNGNPAGTIIEKGRDDIVQIIGEDDEDYKINMDIVGNPVVDGNELSGINWTLRVDSTVYLKELGYKLNLTTVEGSGLGEIQNVKINGKSVELKDQLDGKLGISDSKHHALNESEKTLVYTFYTPRTNKQGSYMIDVSTILTKKNNKVGALRHILKEGYPQDKIEKESPNRTSMNNRTTIKGEFKTESTAQWTITDAVSTGDKNKGLPLEKRTLDSQSLNTGKRAVYGINTTTGMMEVKNDEATISNVPAKESNPAGSQAVGNIGVYKFDTKLNTPNNPTDYSVGGVTISKYKDIIVDQHWSLAEGYDKMPAQSLTVIDNDKKELGKINLKEEDGHQRVITIPNVRFWNIASDGKASMIDHKIDQTLPTDSIPVEGKNYIFREKANYYDENSKSHYITNAQIEDNKKIPATFTVIKVDSKDQNKRIPGANFYLLGAKIGITTDNNGEATFRNIEPGTYYLKETKAPTGYKLDQEQKTITILDDGEVSVLGKNAQFSLGSGKTDLVEHSDYPNWPDFMNSMHYGKVDENGNVKFYIYLKPYAQRAGGRTDKDTTLNISLPNVNLQDSNINVYDVSGGQRSDIFGAMNSQTVDQEISSLGKVTLGAQNNGGAIEGKADVANPLSGTKGYQITFPQGRFGTDWGFLVEVSANIGSKDSTSISYDWLAKENPAGQSKIRVNTNLSKNKEENGNPTITIANEEQKKSEIEVAKFADTSTEGKKDRLAGAEFVLKDENGEVIANKITDENGKVSFGEHPTGTYYLEEVKAPEGYEKSKVYFRVTVSEDGKVTYDAKFKDSDASPTAGVDYYIEREEGGQGEDAAIVTRVNQSMVINDDSGSGNFRGIWEAYRLESLKYHLDATISNAAPGSRFEIQFDPNLDFTQYFKTFPNIYFNGKMIATPHFDYKTNLLTYVFNKNSLSNGETKFSIDLNGMIPSKFYATHSGKWDFTNVVAPNQKNGTISGNPVDNIKVQADYDGYDRHTTAGKFPSQAYYFRDVYKADDGNWYVKAIGYYNPLGDYKTGDANKIWFNWKFTDNQGSKQETWQGKYESPYYLDDVKIYKTSIPPLKKYEAHPDYSPLVNDYMPLSMGVRPEQNPDIYNLVYHAEIDHEKSYNRSEGGFNLSYNPKNVTSTGSLYETQNPPLTISVPKINPKNDAYLIEQTFKIRDIDEFNKHWRAFYMANGEEKSGNRKNALNSSFVTGPNDNYSKADQTGTELPSYTKEVVGIINRKYQPGKFKITKLNEANQNQKLKGATFVLTDSDNNKIYRTSDQNGEISFENLAPGKYTLKEYKSPKDFIKSSKEWNVTVYSDGNVKISSTSIIGGGESYTGKDTVNIPVNNKPAGQKFRIYKKDSNGKPLAGAKFKITDPENKDPNFPLEAQSDQNGIVEFTGNPQEGKSYILEEVAPPEGYKPLNKKWVLVREDGKTKIYTYSKSDTSDIKSILGEEGTHWVNVKERPTRGWTSFDNRITGWVANSTEARYLGTRIVAINKDNNYVIQRYVINPEGRNIDDTTAIIHREKPEYPNMDWYNGDEEVRVFTLDPKEDGNTSGKVTGLISDLRLADYNETDITANVTKSVDNSHYGEKRLKLNLPATNKPIVVDVKIPYKTLDGGVGTGMDWYEGGQNYWKSDYYERVSDILESDPTTREEGSIIGSYISEGSLDVENEIKTYGFKIKKVREINKTTPIQGATFKLTGPDPSKNERYMTSGKDGMISFNGLKPGTYTLVESEPASGYQKVDTKWTVTISADGKAYIKQNNENAHNASLFIDRPTRLLADKDISNKEFIDKRSYQFAKIAKDSRDENEGLEISELNPSDLLENAQRAASDWEKIDPTRSNPVDVRSNPAKDNAAPVLTKITEINKVDNRLRQVFVYGEIPYGAKNREIQIHSEPQNFNVTKNNSGIKVYQSQNYDIDNPGSLTDITTKIRINEKTVNGKTRLIATIPATYKGTIRVEIETQYDERFGVGLGTYYHSNTAATNSSKPWLANSYSNESAINKGPVITYETAWEYDSEIPKSQTIDVPEKDLYEDETWTVQGSTGKLYKEYKYELADGVRTGNKTATGNTKANPEAKADEYHHGTKKRPESRTSTPVNKTIEVPFETTVKNDPNLAQGVIEVDSQGENGEAEYQYSVTFDRKNEPDATKPENWPADVAVPAKQAGERIAAYNIILVRTIKEKTDRIERHGSRVDGEELVDNTATITNKQTGLDLKILKRGSDDKILENAEFTLEKYTDESYKTKDDTFKDVSGKSNSKGNVELKDKDGNPVSLPVGYYRLTETNSPSGYKKLQAPFDIEVYEEAGQLKAKYKGPEHTSYDYIQTDKSYDNTSVQTADNGIKYKSKLVSINTESKTYIQRIYIDTRGYRGASDKINIQINPKHKREETDRGPGNAPTIDVEGVKTAYRSTYKITGAPTNDSFADTVLNSYDLSRNDVTMLNTARWRPFDWGFDEDIMNLDKGGVYYIDVEGFYDDAILTGKDSKQGNIETIPQEDLKKLELNFDFYDGAREFQQATGRDNRRNIIFKKVDKGSYQQGNLALGFTKFEKSPDGQLGKTGGRIYPLLKESERTRVKTSIDLKSLYSSKSYTEIPQSGMTVVNEVERYNVTFSKHGRDNPKDNVNSENVTKNRLEGAIFKLQKEIANTYTDIPGAYVGSAFNGYFGFRNLEPGRYRLMEVKAPKDYKPITDPLLYFTIKTVKTNTGEVVDPESGDIVDLKTVNVRFVSNGTIYNLSELEMEDPKDSNSTLKIGDKSVLSKDIDIEKAKIINPETGAKVLLKDLIVVGEKQYKEDGKTYYNEYPVKQIKIVPSSSGYISLEYDKANGVYQYVPEKSTSEKDGKLIDFVTSATAKNMGKIVNEKPGEGEMTVTKVDQNGNEIKASELLAGAKFKLTNLSNGSITTKTVGEDGTIHFDKLPIGNYRLEEVKSPDGYVNTNQVWNFTIGGEGLDPYAGPIARTGRDLSDKIKLNTTDMYVLNPEDKTSKKRNEIHPHFGESMEFTNKFAVDKNIKINPGDYFVLNMSEVTDLNGISDNEIENLDIIAAGIGTIAKADYDRSNRTITYTFTDYAKTYSLVEFSNKLTSFIDLYKVRQSDQGLSKQQVGFYIGNDRSQLRGMKVIYDLDYGHEEDIYRNRINLVSKIVKYNPQTGEFLHYYYVNRLREKTAGPVELRYVSEQDIENLNISVSYLYNNSNVENDMPESFAVNENSNNLSQFDTVRSLQRLNKGYYTSVNFNNGIHNTHSYIIKVTGRVAEKDKSEYTAHGTLLKFNQNYSPTYAERHDSVRHFVNEASGSVKPEIVAVNPENKILFRKVDQEGKALAKAKFKLKYKAKSTDKEWSDVGDEVTSGEDGKFEFTKLKPGFYELEETLAPEGYNILTNPAYEFVVNDNGKIIRKTIGDKPDEEKDTEEDGIVPIYIENKKDQHISFEKVDANTGNPLEGAEFEVWYKKEKTGDYSKTELKLYQNANGDKLVLNKDETAPQGFNPVDKFTTGADGLVEFTFYESGYYALKEIKAPSGYITPKDYVKEFAAIDGKIQVEKYKADMVDIDTKDPIQIENKKFTLPMTNGLRAWIGFTILGLILMILAVWYHNKRKNKSLDITSK